MFGIDDAALALLASGAIGTAGSLYANSANRKAQAHINDINWQVAAQNNATQINMANTAHQREVADLRAAGLNPILSSGGNGASTPSLTNVRGESTTISNPLEGLASSARGLKDYLSQSYAADLEGKKLANQNTQVANDLADIEYRRQENSLATELLDQQNDFLRAQVDQDALVGAYGMRVFYDDDGNAQVRIDNPDKYQKMMSLREQAIEASAADASNVNWRNNLNAGLGVVNTAASLGFGVGRLRHATKMLDLSRDRNVLEWDKFNWRQQHDQWRKK